MITNILAITPPAVRTISLVGILVVLIYALFFGLIIVGMIRLVKYLGSAGKEQKLIRMELGKLAEEVHQLRQDLKGGRDSGASAQ